MFVCLVNVRVLLAIVGFPSLPLVMCRAELNRSCVSLLRQNANLLAVFVSLSKERSCAGVVLRKLHPRAGADVFNHSSVHAHLSEDSPDRQWWKICSVNIVSKSLIYILSHDCVTCWTCNNRFFDSYLT